MIDNDPTVFPLTATKNRSNAYSEIHRGVEDVVLMDGVRNLYCYLYDLYDFIVCSDAIFALNWQQMI